MGRSAHYLIIIIGLADSVSVFNSVINFTVSMSELIMVINTSEFYYLLVILFF